MALKKIPLRAPRRRDKEGDRRVENSRLASQEDGRSLPLELFHLLLLHPAVDAEGSYGSGHQPFFGYWPVADIADAEDAVVHPFERLLHLDDQLSLPIADPEFEIPVRFERGAVVGVWIVFLDAAGHFRHGFSRLPQKLVDLLVKHVSEELDFSRCQDRFRHFVHHFLMINLGKLSYMTERVL